MTRSRMFSFSDPDKIAYIVNKLDTQLADYASLLDTINKEEDAKKKDKLRAQFGDFQGSLWLAFIASLKDNLERYRNRLEHAIKQGGDSDQLQAALAKLNAQSIARWEQQRQTLLKQKSADSLFSRIFGAVNRKQSTSAVTSSPSNAILNELHKQIFARDQEANRIAVLNELAQEKLKFETHLAKRDLHFIQSSVGRLPTLLTQMQERQSALEEGEDVPDNETLDQEIIELNNQNEVLQQSAQVIKQYQRNLNRIREQSSSDPKIVSEVDDLLSPDQQSIKEANLVLYLTGSPASIPERFKPALDQTVTALNLATVLAAEIEARPEKTKANNIIDMTQQLETFLHDYDFSTLHQHVSRANEFSKNKDQYISQLDEIKRLKRKLEDAEGDIGEVLRECGDLDTDTYSADEIGNALRQHSFSIFTKKIDTLFEEAKRRHEITPAEELPEDIKEEAIKAKLMHRRYDDFPVALGENTKNQVIHLRAQQAALNQLIQNLVIIENDLVNAKVAQNKQAKPQQAKQDKGGEKADSGAALTRKKTAWRKPEPSDSENISAPEAKTAPAAEGNVDQQNASATENISAPEAKTAPAAEGNVDQQNASATENISAPETKKAPAAEGNVDQQNASATENILAPETKKAPAAEGNVDQQNASATENISAPEIKTAPAVEGNVDQQNASGIFSKLTFKLKSNPSAVTSPWVRSAREDRGVQHRDFLTRNTNNSKVAASSSDLKETPATSPVSPSLSRRMGSSSKIPTRGSRIVTEQLSLAESLKKTQENMVGYALKNNYKKIQRSLEVENENIEALAMQLTNWSRQLFRAIPPEEFLEKDKPELRPYSRLMTNAFNNLSNFVIKDILHTESFEERLLVINRWFKVLQKTYAAGDYHTAFAISMAFSSTAIQDRLKKSWVSLPQEMLTFLAEHQINNESFKALSALESLTKENNRKIANDHSKGKEKEVAEVQGKPDTAIIPHMGYYGQQYEQYSTSLDRLEDSVKLMQEMQKRYLIEEGATKISDIIDSLAKNYITNGARAHAAKDIDKVLKAFISGLEATVNPQTPALKSLVDKLNTFRHENFVVSQGVLTTAALAQTEDVKDESQASKKIKNMLRRRKGKPKKKSEEIKSPTESPQKKDIEASYDASRFVEKSASIFSRTELAEEFKKITQPLVAKDSVISNELHAVIENLNNKIEIVEAKRNHSLAVLAWLQQTEAPTSQPIPIAEDIGSEKKWLNGDIVGEGVNKKEFDEKESILTSKQDEEAKQLNAIVSPLEMLHAEQISYRLQMLNYVNQMEALGTSPADYSGLFLNPQIAEKIKTLSMSKENIIHLLPDVEKINLTSFVPVNDETFKELFKPFIAYRRDKLLGPLFTDQEIKKINSKNNIRYQIHNIELANLLAALNLNQEDIKFINAALSNVNVMTTQDGRKELIGINKDKLMDLLQDIVRKKEKETNSFFKRFKAQPPWKSKLEVDEPTFQKQVTAILEENVNLLKLIKNNPDLLSGLEIKQKETSERTKEEEAKLKSAEELMSSWLESYTQQLRFRNLSAHLMVDEQQIENTKRLNQAIHSEKMINGRENIARILDLLAEERQHIEPFLSAESISKINENTEWLDSLIGIYNDHLKELNNEISTLLPEELKSKFKKFIDQLSAEETSGAKVEIPSDLKNELRKILQEGFVSFEEQLNFKLSLNSVEPTLKKAIDRKESDKRKPLGPGSTSS